MEILDHRSLALVSATLCVIAFVGFASKLCSRPRETSHVSPIIPQSIPFVGHLIEIVKHGFGYLEHLGAKHKHPIFTLQILGKDVHVVNSPDLIMAVQKTPRIYDFSVFATTMLPRLFDLDREAMKLASTNVDHPGGSWNFIVETTRIFHRCLTPGPSLEKMERTALTAILHYLDELASKPDGVVLDLFAWLRTMMTVSSTEALYGPQNPFNNRPDLEQALWDWERDLTRLLLAPAPALLARKGYRARSRLINAMNDYLESSGHETGSDLTKARYEAGITYGLSIPNIARFELGSIMGVLVNSTPTLFWMLTHIYSDAQLLADLRAELSLESTNQPTAHNGTRNKHTINTTTLQHVSPLLLSIYQETLRLHTHNSSSRMVTQDTTLAKRYRLQANSMILIPGGAIHALPSIWGASAHEFHPRRFLASTSPHADIMKLRPGTFRSFGGGVPLCPGRHFAATEICAAAAMVVARFEMVAVDAGGEGVGWWVPGMEVGRVTSAIPLPRGDVRVRVSVREEGGEGRWGFGFGGLD